MPAVTNKGGYYSKASCERGKPISHPRKVKAASIQEAVMKNQQGINGSVHTKTSANQRLIMMNERDLQHG